MTILWVWSNAFLLKRRAAAASGEAMASAAAEFSLGSSRASMEHPIKAKAEGEIPIHIWSIAEQSSYYTCPSFSRWAWELTFPRQHHFKASLTKYYFLVLYSVKVFLLFSLLTLSFAKKLISVLLVQFHFTNDFVCLFRPPWKSHFSASLLSTPLQPNYMCHCKI